ncbi:MAG: hypothetical protein R3B93_12890 [Bacteroidia bacterium]
MHPILKINQLTNLQDARSSAAVGFDLISFSLERGNPKKLSAAMVWNIVNWLSGPEIVLDLNVASLEELPEVENMFPYRYMTIPLEEWNELLLEHADHIICKADQTVTPAQIMDLVESANQEDKEIKFELFLSDLADAQRFSSVKEHIFIHFSDISLLEAHIQSGDFAPFGYTLGEEAEEEPGVLHYERIDDFLEIFFERFPRQDEFL